MGSPNQSYEFPELSRLGHDAEAWALQALAGVELRAYTNAMWTRSRMTDVLVASSVQQSPQQREPYWSGSQAVRAQVATYVPDKLSPEDEQRSIDETTRLLEEIGAHRAPADTPTEPVRGDANAFNSIAENYGQTATNAPAVEMTTSDAIGPATQAPQTPMQQVEAQLPADNPQLNYNGKPVDQILDEIGYLHDEAGNE